MDKIRNFFKFLQDKTGKNPPLWKGYDFHSPLNFSREDFEAEGLSKTQIDAWFDLKDVMSREEWKVVLGQQKKEGTTTIPKLYREYLGEKGVRKALKSFPDIYSYVWELCKDRMTESGRSNFLNIPNDPKNLASVLGILARYSPENITEKLLQEVGVPTHRIRIWKLLQEVGALQNDIVSSFTYSNGSLLSLVKRYNLWERLEKEDYSNFNLSDSAVDLFLGMWEDTGKANPAFLSAPAAPHLFDVDVDLETLRPYLQEPQIREIERLREKYDPYKVQHGKYTVEGRGIRGKLENLQKHLTTRQINSIERLAEKFNIQWGDLTIFYVQHPHFTQKTNLIPNPTIVGRDDRGRKYMFSYLITSSQIVPRVFSPIRSISVASAMSKDINSVIQDLFDSKKKQKKG